MVQGSSSIRELSTRMKKDVPSTFNRIREWNKWSEDESDAFRRFIFRWISFMGYILHIMKAREEAKEITSPSGKL